MKPSEIRQQLFKKPSQVSTLPDKPTREQLTNHQLPCHTAAGVDRFNRAFNGTTFTRTGQLCQSPPDFRFTTRGKIKSTEHLIAVTDPTPTPRKRSKRYPERPPIKLYRNGEGKATPKRNDSRS